MNHKPILYTKIVRSSEPPKLVKFLIRKKIVRTETHAIFLLLIVVIVSSLLAFYFFSSSSEELATLVSF